MALAVHVKGGGDVGQRVKSGTGARGIALLPEKKVFKLIVISVVVCRSEIRAKSLCTEAWHYFLEVV